MVEQPSNEEVVSPVVAIGTQNFPDKYNVPGGYI